MSMRAHMSAYLTRRNRRIAIATRERMQRAAGTLSQGVALMDAALDAYEDDGIAPIDYLDEAAIYTAR